MSRLPVYDDGHHKCCLRCGQSKRWPPSTTPPRSPSRTAGHSTSPVPCSQPAGHYTPSACAWSNSTVRIVSAKGYDHLSAHWPPPSRLAVLPLFHVIRPLGSSAVKTRNTTPSVDRTTKRFPRGALSVRSAQAMLFSVPTPAQMPWEDWRSITEPRRTSVAVSVAWALNSPTHQPSFSHVTPTLTPRGSFPVGSNRTA